MGIAEELSAAAKCNVLGERACCGIYMEEKCHTVTGGEKKSGIRSPAFFQNRGIEILVGLINPRSQIAAKISRSRKYQISVGCPLIFGEEYLRAGSSVR